MEYYDITPKISSKTAVFPGDTPFSRKVELAFSRGNNIELSSANSSLHIGAHADAPSHYHPKGLSIDRRDLSRYLGKVQVIGINWRNSKKVVTARDLEGVDIRAPRVLFRTNTFLDTETWTDHFAAIDAEVIRMLAKKGVFLIGIDTPSVDPAVSKDLPAHHAIFEADMAILEGLILDQVPAGIYNLVALPLKIEGADASPVRAILLPEQFSF